MRSFTFMASGAVLVHCALTAWMYGAAPSYSAQARCADIRCASPPLPLPTRHACLLRLAACLDQPLPRRRPDPCAPLSAPPLPTARRSDLQGLRTVGDAAAGAIGAPQLNVYQRSQKVTFLLQVPPLWLCALAMRFGYAPWLCSPLGSAAPRLCAAPAAAALPALRSAHPPLRPPLARCLRECVSACLPTALAHRPPAAPLPCTAVGRAALSVPLILPSVHPRAALPAPLQPPQHPFIYLGQRHAAPIPTHNTRTRAFSRASAPAPRSPAPPPSFRPQLALFAILLVALLGRSALSALAAFAEACLGQRFALKLRSQACRPPCRLSSHPPSRPPFLPAAHPDSLPPCARQASFGAVPCPLRRKSLSTGRHAARDRRMTG